MDFPWRFESSLAHMGKITISADSSGKRIDKFLSKEFFSNGDISRAEIIKNIKEGGVLVNGTKVKPSYFLKEGDKLEINIDQKNRKLEPNKDVKFKIIHEDENIIIIDKPAGLLVHPSVRSEKDTLVSGLLAKFPEIKNVGDSPEIRPGIVHRLDRETSGVMVVARNQETFDELKKLFRNRKIKKNYLAFVFGSLGRLGSFGSIDKPLAKAANYKKQVVAGKKTKTKIREAVTEYKVIGKLDGFSLLGVFPKTGRTHQIRVHLFSIGHPIVGDVKYGFKKMRSFRDAGRLYLHAKSLEFELSGKKYVFQSELPVDFQGIIRKLDEKL